MKVRSSVKPICEKCKIIKRKGTNRDKVKIQKITGGVIRTWLVFQVLIYQERNVLRLA